MIWFCRSVRGEAFLMTVSNFTMSYHQPRQRRSSLSGWKIRLIIAGVIVLFSIVRFVGSSTENVITGENQRVGSITTEQEVALGMRAAPEMIRLHGGFSFDDQARIEVATLGKRMAENLRLSLENTENRTFQRISQIVV